MKLGSAFFDRHNALRMAEKNWESSVARFRADVPAHLKVIVDHLFPDDSNHVLQIMNDLGDLEYDFEIPLREDDKPDPDYRDALLTNLEELQEIWKDDFYFSFESKEYKGEVVEIVVTAKAILPPMGELKLRLEQNHEDSDCSWIQIPNLGSLRWSIQFNLTTLAIIIDYDEKRKEFTVYHAPNDKVILETIAEVLQHIKDRVTSYFGH